MPFSASLVCFHASEMAILALLDFLDLGDTELSKSFLQIFLELLIILCEVLSNGSINTVVERGIFYLINVLVMIY